MRSRFIEWCISIGTVCIALSAAIAVIDDDIDYLKIGFVSLFFLPIAFDRNNFFTDRARLVVVVIFVSVAIVAVMGAGERIQADSRSVLIAAWAIAIAALVAFTRKRSTAPRNSANLG